MAKLYTGGFEVVALGGSWHGVTGHASGASYASDRKGYGPGMPGTYVIPEPNACLVEEPGDGGCPSGMLRVDTFCIDRFEAALVVGDIASPDEDVPR